MRPDRAEKILSLFTSADRASAITGDLAEEGVHGGPAPWLDVMRITVALWRDALTGKPHHVAAIAIAGCALLAGVLVLGVAAVALFPSSSDSPFNWIALSVIWCAGAVLTGTSLVALAPSRGMASCGTLAILLEMLSVSLLVRTPPLDLPFVQFGLLYASGLIVPVLLLIGGGVARRRAILDTTQSLRQIR